MATEHPALRAIPFTFSRVRPVHRRHHFRDLLSPEVLEPSPFLPYNLFRHRHVLSDV